jgi:hypothetical protein
VYVERSRVVLVGSNKKPPGQKAQEVVSERDVAFAVR